MGELIFTLMPQLEVDSLLTLLKRPVPLTLTVVALQSNPVTTLEAEMQTLLLLTTRMILLLKLLLQQMSKLLLFPSKLMMTIVLPLLYQVEELSQLNTNAVLVVVTA